MGYSKLRTWLDIDSNDLSLIRSFAMREGEMPATLISRNVLELLKGMYFEVRIDKYDTYTTGIGDSSNVKEPKFRIYPNPIQGELHLSFSGVIDIPFTIAIYELIKNNQVYKGEMNGNPFLLDVNTWKTGFYAILVFDHNGNELFRSRTHIKN